MSIEKTRCLNTENLKICGFITKLEQQQMQFV